MKKNPPSQSGFFNPRVLVALTLCCIGALLGTFSFVSNSSATDNVTAGTPRFAIYMSPPGVADSAGEPSIGSNWTRETICHNTNVDDSTNDIPNGGTSLYFGGFLPAMAKVTWDDCSSPATATWENKPLLSANTPRAFGDPILFTDRLTGRTFVAQLEGLTPAGSTIDITDDDGDTFIPSDGVIPSDIDHQTLGGGRYHDPLPYPGPIYPNAIYYASQSVVEARALRSDTGGLLFSQVAAPMFAITECAGLHGHLKVSPADGTVYVPDFACGGSLPFHDSGAMQAVIVSEDNGITWDIRTIPDSTTSGITDGSAAQTRDPSVAIATDGTVYLAYQAANGRSMVAVSHDKGMTWSPSVDVGANVVNGAPVLNSTFQAIVAGDPDRAAVAFFGTETGGSNWDCGTGNDCGHGPDFTGVWYLYIAATFDGGQTWITQNVTPGDPVQRGGICGDGTCRNLLDFFDATIDKQGRVLVGYDDGCISATCINGGTNDFSAKGAIARQSGGKRMFAAFDPQEPTVPGAPKLAASRGSEGPTANLSWPAPDNGGSTITGYNVYRNSNGGAFTLIASVPTTNYSDTSFTAGDSYHVTAVNQAGQGPFCTNVTPTTVVEPDPCSRPGVLAVNDLNPDGSDNDSGVNTPPDPRVNIRQLFIAEPDFGRDGNGNVIEKLVFTMQLAPSTDNSAPPSSQWYIVWNRQGSDPSDGDDSSFDRMWVGMKTDVTGTLSFEYGKFGVPLDPLDPDPFANTPISFGTADDGSYDVTSGVVTITISNSKFRTIDGGATEYIANSSLPDLNVRTYVARPDGGQRSQNNANDITGNGIYTLAGNASCIVNRPPVASLSASPTEGTAPLTVAFDGSASSDPDGSVVSYTFTFGDGSPAVTQSSPIIQHTYQNPADYFATLTVRDDAGAASSNVASVEIEVHAAPTPTCFEDDDTHLAYNPGWHTVSNADASAGHFRMSQGKGMSFSFQTQAATGTLQYFYATSTKNGSADLYLDGNFVRTLSYRGNSGSAHSPAFGVSTEVALSGTGSHTFELRNASGSVYVDKLCVTEGSSSTQPSSGPGATTISIDTIALGGQLTNQLSVPTTATALAVVAESNGALPYRLVVLDPNGTLLATADASQQGIASIQTPVTVAGMYLIQLVNLGVGPIELWSAYTPHVNR